MSAQKFNEAESLSICGDDEFAFIEQQNEKHRGDIWINYGWLTVADARDLRDWLNEVIP